MAETSQYCTVLVTVPNGTIAETISHALLEAKLAACVSLFPVTSIYTWQGEVQQEGELQLLIKTELARFGEIDAMVRSLHPYEVPEVIALPIVAGSPPYLQWIAEQVTGA